MGTRVSDLAGKLRVKVEQAVPALRAISAAEAAAKPSPKWARKEVLGHLIDSAANNHQRIVRAVLAGDLRFPGYEQNGWVESQGYAAADWNALIDLWRSLNLHLAHVIARVPTHRLDASVRIAEHEPMTLLALIEDYLRHLEHHLVQLGAVKA
jgi:DinB superfamily